MSHTAQNHDEHDARVPFPPSFAFGSVNGPRRAVRGRAGSALEVQLAAPRRRVVDMLTTTDSRRDADDCDACRVRVLCARSRVVVVATTSDARARFAERYIPQRFLVGGARG